MGKARTISERPPASAGGDSSPSQVRLIAVRRMQPCDECGCELWVPVVRRRKLWPSRRFVIALQCADCGRTQVR